MLAKQADGFIFSIPSFSENTDGDKPSGVGCYGRWPVVLVYQQLFQYDDRVRDQIHNFAILAVISG